MTKFMNTTKCLLITALLCILAGSYCAYSAELPGGVAPEAPAKQSGLYADTSLYLRTADFKDSTYGYAAAVGYQFSPVWAADARLVHHGLDAEGSAVQDIGGRVIARLPIKTLSPYTFVGASFNLERDIWHLQPGIGIEFGVTERLKGLSVFGEAGLDADLKGNSGYLFSSGLRWRF